MSAITLSLFDGLCPRVDQLIDDIIIVITILYQITITQNSFFVRPKFFHLSWQSLWQHDGQKTPVVDRPVNSVSVNYEYYVLVAELFHIVITILAILGGETESSPQKKVCANII